MVSNVLGGALLAEVKHEFKWSILKGSLVQYAGLLFIGALLYAGGAMSELALENILGEALFIKEAITIGLATYGVKYLTSALDNFNKLAQANIEGE